MNPFWRGLVIGFCIAAPVGPIGLLCIRRSLVDGRWTGFVTGLGAASADGVYGLLAVSGLTTLTHFLIYYQRWIQGLGGVFLVYLGLSILRSKPPVPGSLPEHRLTRWTAYSSTFFLTLSNPATILSFVGIFAGLGMARPSTGFHDNLLLVGGVAIGSAAWWLLLSFVASWLGKKMKSSRLRWINLVSGSFVVVFGVFQLIQLFG